MDRPVHVLALAASNRRGSLNRRLLDRAVEELGQVAGVEVEILDLGTHPLPLFDADLLARDGMPSAAQAIHDRVAASDALVIASPEYNGGYPALLKNMIDWVSRIDMLVFHPRYVGLLAATPGKGGGRRGLEHLAALFANIFVTTHDDLFTVPRADQALTPDGWVESDDEARMRDWVGGFVAAAVEHRHAREAAA